MINVGRTNNSITIQILKYFYVTLLKSSHSKASSYTTAIGLFSLEFAFAISFGKSNYKERKSFSSKVTQYKVKPTYEA